MSFFLGSVYGSPCLNGLVSTGCIFPITGKARYDESRSARFSSRVLIPFMTEWRCGGRTEGHEMGILIEVVLIGASGYVARVGSERLF